MCSIPLQPSQITSGLLCLLPQPAADQLAHALAIQPCAYSFPPEARAAGLSRLRDDLSRGLLPSDAPLILVSAQEGPVDVPWPGPIRSLSIWLGEPNRCPPDRLCLPLEDEAALRGLAWMLVLAQREKISFLLRQANFPFRLRCMEQRAGDFRALSPRKRHLALQTDRQTKVEDTRLAALLDDCCRRYCLCCRPGHSPLSLAQMPLSFEGFQAMTGRLCPTREVLWTLAGKGLDRPVPLDRPLLDRILAESQLLTLPLAWLEVHLPRYAATRAAHEKRALELHRRALDHLPPIRVPRRPGPLVRRLQPLDFWFRELSERQARLSFWEGLAEGPDAFARELERRLLELGRERQLLELAHPRMPDFPGDPARDDAPWDGQLVQKFLLDLEEPGLEDVRPGASAILLLPQGCYDALPHMLRSRVPFQVLPANLEADQLVLLLRLPIFPKEV